MLAMWLFVEVLLCVVGLWTFDSIHTAVNSLHFSLFEY